MNTNNIFNLFKRLQFHRRDILAVVIVVLCPLFASSCGNSDAEPQVKKFCARVKIGESIMNVADRAGKVDFDKYWFEKFDKEPAKGEVLGVIRPRDLEKNTEKLKKMKHPKTWAHGQFKAMIQELGYSRYVCVVDFAKDKALNKKVLSVN